MAHNCGDKMFWSKPVLLQRANMSEDFATVRLKQGPLRGRKLTKAGNAFFSFQGVPYARPPVGPLRFKPAQTLEAWDGETVRDALKEGQPCPQIEWILKLPYRGDEDCLYLNIYTNNIPSSTVTVKYPVMVWIHGGGFEVGSGDAYTYGPEYLLGEDVVLVTINYRLNIFGFLNVDDDSVHKNLGLKDQVAALRWVKENIAAFGGDPDNVTIFGESAGGASAHFHTLSPMSKGLFHRAIIQSGCALNSFALDNISEELAFKIAKALGSSASTTAAVLSFLKTAPARDLVETFNDLSQKDKTKGSFRPMIEKSEIDGDEVFLPAHPREIMQKQQNHPIPCMIGLTSKEGIIVLELLEAWENAQNLELAGKNLELFIPNNLEIKSTPKEAASKIKDFYIGKESINRTTLLAGLVDLSTDTALGVGIDEATKLLAQGSSPVYYYQFDFDGKLNIYKHFIKANELSGASHLDELGYIFGTPFFKVPEVEPDSREDVTRKRMLKLWTNFAKTGNPTPEDDPVIGVKWPRFTLSKEEYLDISDSLSVKRNLNKERIKFWEEL